MRGNQVDLKFEISDLRKRIVGGMGVFGAWCGANVRYLRFEISEGVNVSWVVL